MVDWAIAKRPVALVGLNLVAAACYLLVGWRTGSLAHIDTSIFSTPDSHTYRQVADWIYGARSSSPASIWVPFLYPTVLGLADRVGGPLGVWAMNVVLWFLALNVTAVAAYRLTRAYWAAGLIFLLLATNISLILLTFQALTEITTVALIAVWLLGLSFLKSPPSPLRVAAALLPVALLVVVKPEFEILLVVTILFLLVAVWRSASRAPRLVVVAACLIPVAAQVALMAGANHVLGISQIGDSTIRGYYLSQLFVYLGMSPDVYSAQPQAVAMSNTALLQFLAAHPLAAVRVFAHILRDNLDSSSNFLTAANPILLTIDTVTNQVYAWVLVAMVPIVAAALWIRRDARLALLSVGALNVFLAGGLSFWQGDRLTVIAIPLWGTALALAVRQVADRVRGARPVGSEPSSTLHPVGAAED